MNLEQRVRELEDTQRRLAWRDRTIHIFTASLIIASVAFAYGYLGATDQMPVANEFALQAVENDRRINELEKAVGCLAGQKSLCISLENSTPSLQQIVESVGDSSGSAFEVSDGIPADAAWIIVSGADRTVESARDELRRVQELGYPAELIFVDGWYRTVGVFPSADEAEAAIDQFRSTIREDAYVRQLARWCGGFSRDPVVDGDGDFIRCEANW